MTLLLVLLVIWQYLICFSEERFSRVKGDSSFLSNL